MEPVSVLIVWMNDQERSRILGDLGLVPEVVLDTAVDVEGFAQVSTGLTLTSSQLGGLVVGEAGLQQNAHGSVVMRRRGEESMRRPHQVFGIEWLRGAQRGNVGPGPGWHQHGLGPGGWVPGQELGRAKVLVLMKQSLLLLLVIELLSTTSGGCKVGCVGVGPAEGGRGHGGQVLTKSTGTQRGPKDPAGLGHEVGHALGLLRGRWGRGVDVSPMEGGGKAPQGLVLQKDGLGHRQGPHVRRGR